VGLGIAEETVLMGKNRQEVFLATMGHSIVGIINPIPKKTSTRMVGKGYVTKSI